MRHLGPREHGRRPPAAPCPDGGTPTARGGTARLGTARAARAWPLSTAGPPHGAAGAPRSSGGAAPGGSGRPRVAPGSGAGLLPPTALPGQGAARVRDKTEGALWLSPPRNSLPKAVRAGPAAWGRAGTPLTPYARPGPAAPGSQPVRPQLPRGHGAPVPASPPPPGIAPGAERGGPSGCRAPPALPARSLSR